MQIMLVFSLIIAFIAIVFAIQNTVVTPIRFMIWESEGSLALILFIALVAGALISYLATAPGQVRRRMTITSQRKQITEVEGRLAASQEELAKAQQQLQAIEAEKEAEIAAESEEKPPEGEEDQSPQA
jgi:putative membrane protein